MNSITSIGLETGDVEAIMEVLNRYSKIQQVILFGSRAKGNWRNGSNIDLALKGDGLKLDDILDISLSLDELNIPNKFDLVIYSRIKEEALKDHINRIGIVLFDRE